MSNKIIGNSSGNIAEVDAGNNLNVTLPQVTTPAGVSTPQYVGASRVFSENDPGTKTGTAYLKSPEVSVDYRTRVGVDAVWDDEIFNYTAQNFTKHKYTSNTLTLTWASGFLNTNGANVTTTGTGCQIQTYRHFPLQGSGALYCEMAVAFSNTPVTNWTFDFGMFLPAAASTTLPQDGVYFRANSSGLFGVANNNGTETTTSVMDFTWNTNQVYKFIITISDSEIEFWIDDVLYAEIPRQTGTGSTFYSGSVPWAIRHHHTGATSGVINAKVSNYSISTADIDNNRLWATNKAGQGLMGIVNPSGAAAGINSNNVNSTVPASATLSNTAAGYATLGGQFQFAAVAGAETDYALFAFLNTVPTTSIMGRNLVIRGIWIDTWVMGAASATTATLLQWSMAVGSTAVSLATTDGTATRLPKRIALGAQSIAVGTPIGGMANQNLDINLDAPVVCEPGTYVHLILRMPVGTATASEIIRGVVGINAYWE
jgi:hypothetical protein